MRFALALLAFSLPALADVPLSEPCAPNPTSTCTRPVCSNDSARVGDECVQWEPVTASDLAGYYVRSYGVDCLYTPRVATTARLAETGCFRADGTAQITVVAIDTGGLRSTSDSNAVTFDSPVVCLRHQNCRTEIDRATGEPAWVCDGCERRCSTLAPLFTTLPVCL